MNYSKNKEFVGKMFDEISPSYDRMNHFMSAGQDILWRKKAVKALQKSGRKFDHILDLAAGSGDFGREFSKLNPKQMFSVDISQEMLKKNRAKIKNVVNFQVRADAESLPFQNNYFDLCGIAFGIRNFENLGNCLGELNRVLNTRGQLVIIEMFRPTRNNIFDRSFKLYFNKIVPVLGNMMSKSKYAYNYLHHSVDSFLTVDSFINMAQIHGFGLVKKQRNFSDIVYTLFLEKK